MPNSIVKVENIWAEDLFKWFYVHVSDSGGDGAAAIVCKNFREASEWFIEWFKDEYSREEFLHPKDEYNNTINYHDGNENFIFTDSLEFNMFSGDYTFIVSKDCIFGNDQPADSARKLIGVDNGLS